MSDQKVIWLAANRINVRPGSFRDYYSKVYSPFQFPVDRFGLLPAIDPDPVPTVNIVPEAVYNLTNLTSDWYDRFVHICDSMAETIYQSCGTRTIIVMYSGGVDSTAVLVAMMRNPKFQQYVDAGQLKVSLNSLGIYEYPEFFYETILPTIPIMATDYNAIMADPNLLVVTGDGGDYVICNTDIPVYEHEGTTDIFHKDKSVIYRYFDLCDPSGKFSHMMRGIEKSAPFDIVSVAQLYWWLGQCFTHQGEMCYPFAWSQVDTSQLATFDRLFRFFLHPKFMTFGFEYMSTNPKYTNLRDMRTFFKDYIINYTGHEQYRNKQKIGSQRTLARKWHKSAIYSGFGYDNLSTRITT
jgi:hypothetical protein